jgi:phosphoenolpyruvate carboxykinase (GTP)
MAMLPFCGYNMADYWQHWLDMGERGGDHMPRIFHVNWFRKNAAGKYIWPGFRENMHVLAWIVERCRGQGESVETPIGWLPTPEALGLADFGINSDDQRCLLSVDRGEWQDEVRERTEFFKLFGDRLPPRIREENEALGRRLD